MARPLRIEYPGAFYHVTARGNEQRNIFKSHRDREKFISYLEAATERYGAIIHAYCLMDNHYHLLLETPQGNLSQIMKHINSSYTTYFNVKRKRSGHLLQGRYKAILVEADAYLVELSRYIHLNPVRAKIVEYPESHPWTSYRYYTEEAAPAWLTTGFILGRFGKKTLTAQKNYRRFVHDMVRGECTSPLREAIASTILGSAEFVSKIQESHLSGREKDSDLPALRKLNNRLSPDEIVKVVTELFDDERQARRAGIYLCHRYSGAKLKEIGRLFSLTESGVTRASKRFENAMQEDEALRKIIVGVRQKLKISNA